MKDDFQTEELFPWDMDERKESTSGIQGLEQFNVVSGRNRA